MVKSEDEDNETSHKRNNKFLIKAMTTKMELIINTKFDTFRQELSSRNNHRSHHRRAREDSDRLQDNRGGLKPKISPFHGKNDPDAYLEWEKKIELVFKVQHYTEINRVRFAAAAFCDYALSWWDQLVKSRSRNGEYPIESWTEMKAIMRKRYIPSHYHSELLRRKRVEDDLSSSRGGHISRRSEFDYGVMEHERKREVHQKHRRERDIKVGFPDFEEIQEIGEELKSLIKKSSYGKESDPEVTQKSETPLSTDNKSKAKEDATRTREVKGFKCKGLGHYANECANKKTVTNLDKGDIISEEEYAISDLSEKHLEQPAKGELLEIQDVSHLVPMDEKVQQEQIIQSECIIQEVVSKDVEASFSVENGDDEAFAQPRRHQNLVSTISQAFQDNKCEQTANEKRVVTKLSPTSAICASNVTISKAEILPNILLGTEVSLSYECIQYWNNFTFTRNIKQPVLYVEISSIVHLILLLSAMEDTGSFDVCNGLFGTSSTRRLTMKQTEEVTGCNDLPSNSKLRACFPANNGLTQDGEVLVSNQLPRAECIIVIKGKPPDAPQPIKSRGNYLDSQKRMKANPLSLGAECTILGLRPYQLREPEAAIQTNNALMQEEPPDHTPFPFTERITNTKHTNDHIQVSNSFQFVSQHLRTMNMRFLYLKTFEKNLGHTWIQVETCLPAYLNSMTVLTHLFFAKSVENIAGTKEETPDLEVLSSNCFVRVGIEVDIVQEKKPLPFFRMVFEVGDKVSAEKNINPTLMSNGPFMINKKVTGDYTYLRDQSDLRSNPFQVGEDDASMAMDKLVAELEQGIKDELEPEEALKTPKGLILQDIHIHKDHLSHEDVFEPHWSQYMLKKDSKWGMAHKHSFSLIFGFIPLGFPRKVFNEAYDPYIFIIAHYAIQDPLRPIYLHHFRGPYMRRKENDLKSHF